MTRDEIIELARASGLLPGTEWPTVETRHTKRKEGELTAFARAIEATTLERAAEIADDMDYDPDGSIAKTIRALKEAKE